jgi:hypothetical protein
MLFSCPNKFKKQTKDRPKENAFQIPASQTWKKLRLLSFSRQIKIWLTHLFSYTFSATKQKKETELKIESKNQNPKTKKF